MTKKSAEKRKQKIMREKKATVSFCVLCSLAVMPFAVCGAGDCIALNNMTFHNSQQRDCYCFTSFSLFFLLRVNSRTVSTKGEMCGWSPSCKKRSEKPYGPSCRAVVGNPFNGEWLIELNRVDFFIVAHLGGCSLQRNQFTNRSSARHGHFDRMPSINRRE